MKRAFQDVASSFYSGPFYGELARLREGVGAGLVLSLTALMSILYMTLFFADGEYGLIHAGLAKLGEIADTLPALALKDGRLSIDKPVPYRILLGDGPEDGAIVIDTDFKASDISALRKYMRENKAAVLLTADKIVAREARNATGGENPLRISGFRSDQSLAITHENWHSTAQMAKDWGGMPWLPAIMFMGTFLGALLVNIPATFLTGFLIMLVGLVMHLKLDFPAALRLAAGARIPANVLCLLSVLLLNRELSPFSEWMVWGMYVVFALGAVRLYSSGSAR